ncbi:HdeD family acid-resistance protein [Neokomagataea tanensis]|uniref:HdeD family acid-resistance protein n=1 Tax=Neokomagataea tanensis TaxID=661191 RepID=A0A4Y6V760_9PROT|nr:MULTISPECIES: HdeD family acid-resistance protein [Neokomagataea]QDH24471.1 HdeD family acid-resistance protein [Neokomagataea tanensis]
MMLTRYQFLKSGTALHGSFRIGLFLITLSIISAVSTLIDDPANQTLLAMIFLLRGSAQMLFSQRYRLLSYSTYWLSNLSATCYLAGGAALLDEPDSGSPLLTFILLSCLTFSGIARTFWGCTHRHVRSWSIMAISGCFTVLTGFLLYLSLPWPTSWLLGGLLSLELFVAGVAAIILAVTTKPTVECG